MSAQVLIDDESKVADAMRMCRAWVALMREVGMVHLKLGQMELIIGPEPSVPEPEEKKSVEPEKRGKDGLTRAEQIELHGTVMDPELE